MNEKLNRIMLLLKEDFRLFLAIGFGIFLFILFFQPFPLEHLDRNNMLVFDAGMGLIIFCYIAIVRVGLHSFIQNFTQSNHKAKLPYYFGGFCILVFSSVTFAFYLRYVGSVNITFHLMFKVIIICLAAPIILFLYDSRKELREQNNLHLGEKKVLLKEGEELEDDYLNKPIEFVSENKNENLNLTASNIAFIKSADNYVEIVFIERDELKKKLLRTTLKNIELQVKPFPFFIRCHRSFIVNFHFIEKLVRNYGNNWIKISGYAEQIPVSRQYLLKVKENI